MYVLAREDGTVVGYKVRWREEGEDGVRRNAAKRFSARKLGSLERARAEATTYRAAAVEIARRGELVLRSDSAARMTVGDLFKEWITEHAAVNLSERYATDAVRSWDREVATRSIARVRLSRLADDPALILRFQDELTVAGLTPATRVQVLKVLHSVLRWGRRRYPRTLTVEFSGLFSLPSQRRRRLIYAADARRPEPGLRCSFPTHVIVWTRIARSSRPAMVLSPSTDSYSRRSARTGRCGARTARPWRGQRTTTSAGRPGCGVRRASGPPRRPTQQVV